MRELSITQKAACEAIWRAFDERGVDVTGFALDGRTEADTRDLIEQIARHGNQAVLDNLTHIEVQRHGPLKFGYSMRWGTAYKRNPAPSVPKMPGL